MAISGSLNFISASVTGSANINIDFVGLNTLIFEPLTASSNNLGYPSGTPSSEYYNSSIEAMSGPEPNEFNSLMLHRNGPYGHPMWKRFRTAQHPLARYYRRNNLISIDENNPIPNTLANASTTQMHAQVMSDLHGAEAAQKIESLYGPDRFADLDASDINNPDSAGELNKIYNNNTSLKQHYEPVLITKYKPLTYQVGNLIRARQTLMNEITFFTDPELNRTLRIASGDTTTGSNHGDVPVRKLKHNQYFFFKAATSTPDSNYFVYSERLYPRSVNAYRPYKLKRPNYEETYDMVNIGSDFIPSGSKAYDGKPGKRISFWRTIQGSHRASAVSDGSTRMRTDGAAKNSLFANRTVYTLGSEPEDTRYKSAVASVVLTSSISSYWTASADNLLNTGSRPIFDSFSPGNNPWNNITTFSMNGVVASQHSVMTGGAHFDLGDIPAIEPRGAFAQLESYQPYEITALSMWPLDPRPDIYERPVYLTSSIGGRGLQIGLTPHRAGYPYFSKTGSYVSELGEDTAAAKKPTVITSSVFNLNTGSAGELVYSTKPTLFFYRSGSEGTNLDGYGVGKASPQYLRHTFPYNTPFYATNKIRGVDPFYNSYSDFFGDMSKYFGRDYTIIPEYNMSDHLEEYFTSSGKGPKLMREIHRTTGLLKIQNYDLNGIGTHKVNLFLPKKLASAPPTHKVDSLDLHGATVTSSAQDSYTKSTQVVADTPGFYEIRIMNLNNIINDQTITLKAADGTERTYTAKSSENISSRHFHNDGSRTGTLSSLKKIINQQDSDYFNASYSIMAAADDPYTPLRVEQTTSGEESWYGQGVPSSNNKLGGVTSIYVYGTNKIAAIAAAELLKYKDVTDPEATTSLSDSCETGSYGLAGNSSSRHWALDRQSVKFAALFGETDTLKNFSNMLFEDGFEEGGKTIPFTMAFDVKAIKKMRIRDGFYPVTRTVHLAAQFADAFLHDAGTGYKNFVAANPSPATDYGQGSSYTSAPNERTRAAMCKQTFLEPLFGPGLLYNSIKSGIAVDWPLYAQTKGYSNIQNIPVYYMPTDFYSGDDVKSAVSATFNYGGMYMMGSSRCFPSILANAPSHRLPFEALYGLLDGKMNLLADKNIFLPSDFVDLDRRTANGQSWHEGGLNNAFHAGTGAIADNAGAIFKTEGNAGFDQDYIKRNPNAIIYNSSMNNFLSEMMEFFLADADPSPVPGIKFQVITPDFNPALGAANIDTNKKYFMEVGLRMGKHQVTCEGPRRAGIATTASSNIGHTLGGTMRGYLYGPPIEVVSANLSAGSSRGGYAPWGLSRANQQLFFNEVALAKDDYEMYFYYNLQDPAYQAFTPPYFYGPSSKILRYQPVNTTDQYDDIWFDSLHSDNTFYYENYITGGHQGDTEGLCLVLPSTSSVSRGAGTRMKVDASIEFSDVIAVDHLIDTGAPTRYTSYISPRWTCPILDFSSSFSAVEESANLGLITGVDRNVKLVGNTFHDHTTGRGLWGGYGTDPYDVAAMESIYDKISVDNRTMSKGLYLSVKDIFLGDQKEYEQSVTYVDEFGTDEGGFYTMQKPTSSLSTFTSLTGSLCDMLQFDKTEYKIGQIASRKTVHEAIVIIPYLDERIDLRPKTTLEVLNGYQASIATQETEEDSDKLDMFLHNFQEQSYEMGIDRKELFSTREIIPGKHFLPIQKDLFNQMLSLFLAEKYIPKHKRGKFIFDDNKMTSMNFDSHDLHGAASSVLFNNNLATAKSTDVGRMIQNLIGDGSPHQPSHNQPYTHNLGFQIPPEFDFIHDRNIDPFQMIIIPFSHNFDKQDLIDIYQGIMPKAARFSSHEQQSGFVNPGKMTEMLKVPGSNGETVEYPPAWLPYMVKNAKTRFANAQEGLMGELGEGNTSHSDLPKNPTYLQHLHKQLWEKFQNPTMPEGQDKDEIITDKVYLGDLGLENFMCPPLMQGAGPLQTALFWDFCDKNSSTIPTWLNNQGAKGFYENVRFMVFKVKQRATKDFKEYRDKQIRKVLVDRYVGNADNPQRHVQGEEILENVKIRELYGSNWPYDFFSLLETAKINIRIGVAG